MKLQSFVPIRPFGSQMRNNILNQVNLPQHKPFFNVIIHCRKIRLVMSIRQNEIFYLDQFYRWNIWKCLIKISQFYAFKLNNVTHVKCYIWNDIFILCNFYKLCNIDIWFLHNTVTLNMDLFYIWAHFNTYVTY